MKNTQPTQPTWKQLIQTQTVAKHKCSIGHFNQIYQNQLRYGWNVCFTSLHSSVTSYLCVSSLRHFRPSTIARNEIKNINIRRGTGRNLWTHSTEPGINRQIWKLKEVHNCGNSIVCIRLTNYEHVNSICVTNISMISHYNEFDLHENERVSKTRFQTGRFWIAPGGAHLETGEKDNLEINCANVTRLDWTDCVKNILCK